MSAIAIRALAATLRSTNKLFTSLNNVDITIMCSNYDNNHTTAKLMNYATRENAQSWLCVLRFNIITDGQCMERGRFSRKRRSMRVPCKCRMLHHQFTNWTVSDLYTLWDTRKYLKGDASINLFFCWLISLRVVTWSLANYRDARRSVIINAKNWKKKN